MHNFTTFLQPYFGTRDPSRVKNYMYSIGSDAGEAHAGPVLCKFGVGVSKIQSMKFFALSRYN